MYKFCLLLGFFALFADLGVHNLVFIVKILREASRGHVLDLSFEDFGDGVAHLLEDVEEEHEFVLALLTVRHVIIQIVNASLQLLIFREDLTSLLRLVL